MTVELSNETHSNCASLRASSSRAQLEETELKSQSKSRHFGTDKG